MYKPFYNDLYTPEFDHFRIIRGQNINDPVRRTALYIQIWQKLYQTVTDCPVYG